METTLADEKNFKWPVEIESVSKGSLKLKQPLRLDVRPEWNVSMHSMGKYIEEVGVENFKIKMVSGQARPHHLEEGFNGIFFHRVWNAWAKNIAIEDADNGVLLDGAKNVTVSGLKLLGDRKFHHGTFTKSSHDCLLENFEIEAPVIHGINVEYLSTGIVWRKGLMKHGTFDMHRNMPFDLIRTDITVHNDGRPGGSENAGPLQGVHVVHWNIRATGATGTIYKPDLHPLGALVGIQGVAADGGISKVNQIPGDKGAIVTDDGRTPKILDLFQSQVEWRHASTKQ